jgi:type IV secretory pathway VirB10-like protein
MTTAASDSKQPPEKMELRAAPRRALRPRRGVIIAAGAILTLTMLSLQSPSSTRDAERQELALPAMPPVPEALAGLPTDYSQVKPDTPLLGPPLPGDLGRPILEQQRRQGNGPAWSSTGPENQPSRSRSRSTKLVNPVSSSAQNRKRGQPFQKVGMWRFLGPRSLSRKTPYLTPPKAQGRLPGPSRHGRNL